jgi:MFS family permease
MSSVVDQQHDSKENSYRVRNKNITLMIIYINVVLYATCYQIQRPLEPFLVEKLNLQGDSSDEYARLQSFFSVMQTIGSFVSGRFLDQFGAKGGFVISFLASALSYAFLSQSTTLTILYISKIPSIFQAGFLCAQLSASQVTLDGAERVEALGRLTFCYTIGSIIGPTIGSRSEDSILF